MGLMGLMGYMGVCGAGEWGWVRMELHYHEEGGCGECSDQQVEQGGVWESKNQECRQLAGYAQPFLRAFSEVHQGAGKQPDVEKESGDE